MSESNEKQEFERLAEGERQGLVAELIDLLRHNKKWWLTPILLVILLLGALVILTGTGVGPFAYTLF
jgi:hypothetical protein